MNEGPAGPGRRSSYAPVAVVLALILCALPFYVTVMPPMADVPAHVLVARIIADYGDPVLRYSDYFTIQWAIAPCTLFYLLFVRLQQWVGPYWDARIYLTIWVGLIWVSVWFLARVQRHRDPWIAALVALPLAFSWYAYNGFLPFLMTLPLFGITVGVWLSDWRPTVKIPSLWVLLAFLFGFHIVGTAAAVAVILIAAATQVFLLREDRRQLSWAVISVIPVVLTTALYLRGEQGPRASIGYTNLLSQAVDVIKFTVTTLNDAAGVLMLLWLGAVGLVLMVRWRDSSRAHPVFISGVFLVGLSIAMPGSLGALWPAGPRLLPFAVVLLIASVRWAELPKVSVTVSCVVLLAALSLLTARHAVALDRGFQDILGAADIAQPGKRVLPIIVDPYSGSRWTKPYLHVGAIHTIKRGGSNPYVFAEPHVLTGAAPLKFRHESDARQFAFFYDKTRGPADYRGVGDYYDYVLLWGSSPAVAGVIEQEMVRLYAHGDATLFARRQMMENQDGSASASSTSQTASRPR